MGEVAKLSVGEGVFVVCGLAVVVCEKWQWVGGVVFGASAEAEHGLDEGPCVFGGVAEGEAVKLVGGGVDVEVVVAFGGGADESGGGAV